VSVSASVSFLSLLLFYIVGWVGGITGGDLSPTSWLVGQSVMP